MQSDDSLDFNVNLNNFNGSLEILLDLAKSQKVDLEQISITKLADQFHQYITEKENLNLEIASEYLLMACLLYTSPSPRDISGSRMPSSA